MEDLTSSLNDLQSRYREMEAQIRLTNDDSVQTIKMQRQKIKKLRNDNKRLKEELEIETRQAKRSLEKTGATTLASLQQQGNFYEKKMELEKQKIVSLDNKIKLLEKQILEQRSDMGGINASREASGTIRKNIR